MSTRARLFALIASLIALTFVVVQLGCATTSMGSRPQPALMRLSDNYDFDRRNFVNGEATDSSFSLGKLRGVVKRYRENVQRPAGPIPMGQVGRADLAELPEDGVRISWVGHSTILLEFDGFRVLTDPVWSERVTPFPSIGPKRFHEPGIAFDDLPRIDAVIISHDHYDHLDHDTIGRLAWRNVKFFVPLGVGAHLQEWGIRQVHELDWWESATLERDGRQMELVATPARHFSGRGLLDRDKTLWASWVVRGDSNTVYFGGDTGYFEGFRTIGEKYGPFAATLIPIGAYDPAWSDIHLNPEEAVQAHLDLGNTGVFVPTHYATFNLATHGWAEPMERLLTAVQAEGVAHYALPLPGQSFSSHDETMHQAWWRSIER